MVKNGRKTSVGGKESMAVAGSEVREQSSG